MSEPGWLMSDVQEDLGKATALFEVVMAENAQLREQLEQLQRAVQLLLANEDGSGRLSHNIGTPCGLCEAHQQLMRPVDALLAAIPDAPNGES